jgi:hypothetical protein
MNKRVCTLLTLIGLSFLSNSCCPFIKEDNLGNNFFLSEYDNADRTILYSEESCSGSGIEIVPMTVVEYANNSSWIIAKSSLAGKFSTEYGYWLINKDFKVKLKRDNDSAFKVVKSHVVGPLDSTSFFHSLQKYKIKLALKKI